MSGENDNVLNWTDLPEGMTAQFVSRETDHDHPHYLSEEREWVHVEVAAEPWINVPTRIEPFLIMELNRFVPYSNGPEIEFHPVNMPDAKISLIEITGFVLNVRETKYYYEYRVDDQTGIIHVTYDKKFESHMVDRRKRIEDRYMKHLSSDKIDIDELALQVCPNRFPDRRPGFKYPTSAREEEIYLFEHNWAAETRNGFLGEKIVDHMHVCAKGYCQLRFSSDRGMVETRLKEVDFRDLSQPELILKATEVTYLPEKDYHNRMLYLMENDIQKRYNVGPLEKFTDEILPL